MLQDIRSFLLKQMLLKTLIFLFQSLYSGILDKHAPINPLPPKSAIWHSSVTAPKSEECHMALL